ncbi:MAG: hypothetical protein RIS94_805 [Pseudomonadota bacterium]|jgi:ferredoxin
MHMDGQTPESLPRTLPGSLPEPLMVVANLDLCQGHARCEDLCPQVFATDAVEGKVVIAEPVFPPALEDKVRLAVRNCPEGALRIARRKGAGA